MEASNCKSKLCNGKVIGLLSILFTVIIVVVVLAIVGVFDGSSSDNDSKNAGESSNVNDDDVSDVITMDMNNSSNMSNITTSDNSAGTDDSVGYTKKKYKYSGMTFTDGRYCPFISMNSNVSNDSLAHLADIGANWVAIIVTWYQNETDSTIIFPQYEPIQCTPSSAHGGLTGYCKTVSDDDLIATINTARNIHNLSVFLKPHIDPINDAWRGDIQPSDEWFESYTEFILHYAEIANDLEVEMFSVETELQGTTGSDQDAHWRSVITQVRASYPHGLLTASANGGGGDCYNINWWDATEIDVIGCDEYTLVFALSGRDYDPNNYHNLTYWMNRWEKDIASGYETQLYNKFNKTILFTEIGFCSGTGLGIGACWETADNSSLIYQKIQYEAALKAMSNYDWFEGFFWWNWATDAAFGGDDNSCMDPKFKPTEGLLRDWYDAPNNSIPNINDLGYGPTCECWL